MKTVSIGGHAPTMLTPLGQHRTIPAFRLKHRFGGSPRQEPPQAAVALRSASLRLGVRHGNCVAKMLDNVGLRYPHRASGQKPLALCDRCPCFGSLHPPLAALTFAAQSIICAFGLASAAPRSPYRHLELCGIVLKKVPTAKAAGTFFVVGKFFFTAGTGQCISLSGSG